MFVFIMAFTQSFFCSHSVDRIICYCQRVDPVEKIGLPPIMTRFFLDSGPVLRYGAGMTEKNGYLAGQLLVPLQIASLRSQ